MAERGDTHYDIRRMNVWFMLSALLLLAGTAWMVLDDWNRPWKRHQRDFRAAEYRRAQEDLAALETPEWSARKEELLRRSRALQARLEDDARYREATAAVRAAEGARYRCDTEDKMAKADWNWERFQFNQAQASGEAAAAAAARFEAATRRATEARAALERAEAELAAARQRLAAVSAERDGLQAELAAVTREVAAVEARMRSVAPSLFNRLRDAPGVDFIAPAIRVRKQVLPYLRKDYSFMTVDRVDMCASCHVAADNPAYAGAEEPLRAHPRLGLFLGSTSPHPLESFGCTICHEGSAETLDFVRAVHVPEDHAEEERWRERYGWYPWHLWDWPMLPARYSEANCYGCHSTSPNGPTLETIAGEAPKLARGLHLMERAGCYNCHNIRGWRDTRKPGPSLRSVAAKLDPAFARAWIAGPHAFRPDTWMPQVFHLENSVSRAWDDTAIASIQAYLWSRSERAGPEPIPAELRAAADPARGEALFRQVGCAGCHNSPVTARHEYSDYGPDLAGIGSKVGEDWLYQWLLDPKGWWPDTRMPDLRLEPQEAADIATLLGGWRKEGWMPARVAPDAGLLRQQALELLKTRYALEEARGLLESWSEAGGEERLLVEVGQRWIARQGCYSCHDIPGFEASMPIGTDLTDWGNKNVHQLAFELWNEEVPGHHGGAQHPSRHAFAELKLSNPRRFDRGLEVAPLDRLRMPDFKLEPDEVEAITTVLLGLKDNSKVIRTEAFPDPGPVEQAFERGSFLVRRYNCLGCHKLEMDTVAGRAEEGVAPAARRYHGLLTLEDEDEEASYFQLWMTDPDLELESAGSGRVGAVAEIPWQEGPGGELVPPQVQTGAGGGILSQLAGYYVETGAVGDAQEAFPLMPPILYGEGEKVRAPWLTQFLLAPYTLRPWLAIRMPSFNLAEDDARSLALYFVALSRREWPGKHARQLRAAERLSADELARAAGITPEQLREIEAGGRFSANAFGKLEAWGRARGFHSDPPPQFPFEEVRERSPVYLAARESETPGYLRRGAALVGPEGVNCYACHIRDGKEPGGDRLSWGPDLSYTRERLRPSWVRRWVVNAQTIYPGTKMPTAFDLLANPRLDPILPGGAELRVQAVADFLLNSDRVPREAASLAQADPSVPAPGSGAGSGAGSPGGR